MKMIEKIAQNTLGHFKCLPQQFGFKVINGDTTIINSGGVASTSMFNIAYGADCKGNVDEYINQVIKAFDDQPFAWWLGPATHPVDLSELLQKLGFVRETTEHAMICDLNEFECNNGEKLMDINEVTTKNHLDKFIALLSAYDPHVDKFYAQFDCTQDYQEKLFVGVIDDDVVTIGLVYLEDDTGGIFSLLTDKEQRGQGYGTAMMKYLMQYIKNCGYDYASLLASSDSGYRIYQRLGFKKVGQFQCLEWAGATQTHR